MAAKETQIEALLTHEMPRLIRAEGLDPKERASYARVFDVTRSEVSAYVATHGLPAQVEISTRDSRRDGLYLVHAGGQWQLYTQDRGCRYDEETFTDERNAQQGLTSLLLSYCGPDFVHLLGFEEAILQFSDWDRPWLFLPQVQARVTHEAGRQCFGYLWFEATATRHWLETDLVQVGQAVEQILHKRYPNLSPAALAAVIRAAAYQWR